MQAQRTHARGSRERAVTWAPWCRLQAHCAQMGDRVWCQLQFSLVVSLILAGLWLFSLHLQRLLFLVMSIFTKCRQTTLSVNLFSTLETKGGPGIRALEVTLPKAVLRLQGPAPLATVFKLVRRGSFSFLFPELPSFALCSARACCADTGFLCGIQTHLIHGVYKA